MYWFNMMMPCPHLPTCVTYQHSGSKIINMLPARLSYPHAFRARKQFSSWQPYRGLDPHNNCVAQRYLRSSNMSREEREPERFLRFEWAEPSSDRTFVAVKLACAMASDAHSLYLVTHCKMSSVAYTFLNDRGDMCRVR